MINKENQKLLDKYLMICRNKGLTINSINAIKVDLKLFLNFIGNKLIQKVTHIDCDDFMMYCMNDRNNGDWALARKHTSINMFFETLLKKEYIEMKINPMYKVDKIKIKKRSKDYLTEDELNKLFNYLREKDDKRGVALLNLLYSSACRISEIHQLDITSLQFDDRTFQVIGKGLKQRECVFSNSAKKDILDYLNSRDDNLSPLFISREGKRWSKRAIQKYVKNIVDIVGINKHITVHSFRHTAITHLRLQGISLDDLALFAGHSSVQTTAQVYSHVGLSDVRTKFDEFYNSR